MTQPVKFPLNKSSARQNGVVAMMLLSLLVLVISSVMITALSSNKIKFRRAGNTSLALQKAHEALLGYSVVQNAVGSLPCPDTDTPRDGTENRNLNSCTANVGGLPYRNLGIDNLGDASATSLWYAVSPNYSDSSGLIIHNSSINNNYSLNGNPVAALVIAPGEPLDGQQRDNLLINNYLEEENANASVDIYAQALSNTNNDLIRGLDANAFWTINEKAALSQIANLLTSYRNACGEFPWAADFVAGTDVSVNSLQRGSIPLNSALPVDWNSGCALGLSPSPELLAHWTDQIYYAFCRAIEGSCLSVIGDIVQNASAVLIAPGTTLALQDRNNYLLTEFFEAENANGNSPFRFMATKNLNGTFNDNLHIVRP